MTAPDLDPRQVDAATIEERLDVLWRTQSEESHGVTRAALWNVIAHTWSAEERAHAATTMGEVSASIPQRTIVIESNARAASCLDSWISAACHLRGGGKQVCSEQISIIAGGDRLEHVPSLVNAILLPDMPVAAWWLGDLPDDRGEYVERLLEPTDRLIVDSNDFSGPSDLLHLHRLGRATSSPPADLNWVRLEEWRLAAAAAFDPPAMHARLRDITSVRLVADAEDAGLFGEEVESLLLAAWIQQTIAQMDRGRADALDVVLERRRVGIDHGSVALLEIHLSDGMSLSIERLEAGLLRTSVTGGQESLTRVRARSQAELLTRQLASLDDSSMLAAILPAAAALAERVR